MNCDVAVGRFEIRCVVTDPIARGDDFLTAGDFLAKSTTVLVKLNHEQHQGSNRHNCGPCDTAESFQ